MDWKVFRERTLEKYRKSPIDLWIKEITDTINSSEDFVTLSSCSGRIVIIDIPESGDKKNSVFLGKWHNPPQLHEVLKALNSGRMETWFIMSPPIIHVACRNAEIAFRLLKCLNESGFRRSGVISGRRNVIEIASSERVEFLAARDGTILVDERAIEENLQKSIEKLEKSRKRFLRFQNRFREVFL